MKYLVIYIHCILDFTIPTRERKCGVKVRIYSVLTPDKRIHNLLIKNTTNYACSCCSFIRSNDIKSSHPSFLSKISTNWWSVLVGMARGQVHWQVHWQVCWQVPLAYINIYEGNPECHNIKLTCNLYVVNDRLDEITMNNILFSI